MCWPSWSSACSCSTHEQAPGPAGTPGRLRSCAPLLRAGRGGGGGTPLLDQAFDVLLVALVRRLRQRLLGPDDRVLVVADHVVIARHPEVDRPLVREALGVELE